MPFRLELIEREKERRERRERRRLGFSIESGVWASSGGPGSCSLVTSSSLAKGFHRFVTRFFFNNHAGGSVPRYDS